MFNIKVAVSRLDFAPDTDRMEVVDISIGRFVFPPLPEREASLAALNQAIVGAGYEIESARLTVVGSPTEDDRLVVAGTGQRLLLRGERLSEIGQAEGPIRVVGVWTTDGEDQLLEVESWSTVEPGESGSR